MTRQAQPYAAQQTASIIDFIDSEQLLGPFFAGESWDRWKAVLRAGFALPMSDRDRELFREVAGSREPPQKPVRELVAAVGRGGGKDSIAASLATFIAVTGDFTKLRPGEKASIVCLAVDRAQARISFNYIRAAFENVPLLAMLIKRVDNDTIELTNGAEIIVQTNNIRSPRGRTICCAILIDKSSGSSVCAQLTDQLTYDLAAALVNLVNAQQQQLTADNAAAAD